MLRLCFAEEWDIDFIRWTSNLLRDSLADQTVGIVAQTERPGAMLASIWRPHPFPDGLPVILVSNENWRVFAPHAPLSRYAAVLSVCRPTEACRFIPISYARAHFDLPVAALRLVRASLLKLQKQKFCCFVVSNAVGELGTKRIEIARSIHAWKPIESAGRIGNNVGYLAPRGLDFLSWIAQYRYMICPENSDAPGYITEKPFQAWFASTVPIYAGGALSDLNGESIVDASRSDVIERIAQLESDSNLYERTRRADIGLEALSSDQFNRQFRDLARELDDT
jgi:hypothetical protein